MEEPIIKSLGIIVLSPKKLTEKDIYKLFKKKGVTKVEGNFFSDYVNVTVGNKTTKKLDYIIEEEPFEHVEDGYRYRVVLC